MHLLMNCDLTSYGGSVWWQRIQYRGDFRRLQTVTSEMNTAEERGGVSHKQLPTCWARIFPLNLLPDLRIYFTQMRGDWGKTNQEMFYFNKVCFMYTSVSWNKGGEGCMIIVTSSDTVFFTGRTNSLCTTDTIVAVCRAVFSAAHVATGYWNQVMVMYYKPK